MNHAIAALGILLTLASCSQTADVSKPDGEIVSSIDSQTFHVKKLEGKEKLMIGERVNILSYEENLNDLKYRDSRDMPLTPHAKKKKIIGQATISSYLKDNFYELKTDEPQHIPSEAYIEKL